MKTQNIYIYIYIYMTKSQLHSLLRFIYINYNNKYDVQNVKIYRIISTRSFQSY